MFFCLWTKPDSPTVFSSCFKLFSFFTCWDEMSLTRGTCAWSPSGLQWQTHTLFWMAPKRLSDKYTQASHNLQFILKRWTSLVVKYQLLRSLACTDPKRSVLVGHAGTTRVTVRFRSWRPDSPPGDHLITMVKETVKTIWQNKRKMKPVRIFGWSDNDEKVLLTARMPVTLSNMQTWS